MLNNVSRGFCVTTAQRGEPLTFTGEYSNGFPMVTVYNGNSFCGVTNENVLNIDATSDYLDFEGVMTGGLINIIRNGTIRIRNFLFVNPEDIDFNKYVKPTKNGWKIQKKKTKKSVGIIQLVATDYVEINMF